MAKVKSVEKTVKKEFFTPAEAQKPLKPSQPVHVSSSQRTVESGGNGLLGKFRRPKKSSPTQKAEDFSKVI